MRPLGVTCVVSRISYLVSRNLYLLLQGWRLLVYTQLCTRAECSRSFLGNSSAILREFLHVTCLSENAHPPWTSPQHNSGGMPIAPTYPHSSLWPLSSWMEVLAPYVVSTPVDSLPGSAEADLPPPTQPEVLCVEPSMHCGCTDVHPIEFCNDHACPECYAVGMVPRGVHDVVVVDGGDAQTPPWREKTTPECPGAPVLVRRSARLNQLPEQGSAWVTPLPWGFAWTQSAFAPPSPA